MCVQSRPIMVDEMVSFRKPVDPTLRVGWDNWYYDIAGVAGLGVDVAGQLAIMVICKVRAEGLGSSGVAVRQQLGSVPLAIA